MKDNSLVASILSNGSPFRAARQMLFVLLVFVLVMGGKTQAQTQTWDPGATTSGSFGSGTWNATNPNWAASVADGTWTSGAAIFGGTQSGTATVTLGSPITATALTFNTSGYDLVASTTNSLTVSGAVTLATNVTTEIDGPGISLGRDTSLGSGSALTLTGGGSLSGQFSGAGATLNITSGNFSNSAALAVTNVNLTGTGELSGSLANFQTGTMTINEASNASTGVSIGSGQTFIIARGGGNSATVNLQSGVLVLGSNAMLKIGNGDNTATSGTLNVQGGTVTGTATGASTGIIIDALGTNTTGSGALNLSSGTVTTSVLWFGSNTAGHTVASTGTASLKVTGGKLFIGTGGIVSNVTGQTQSITLSGGTVGALGNWSSSMNMSLATGTGNITFENDNGSGTAENITLSGNLSGSGGLTTTSSGTGTLTLSGSNSYAGGTTITSGALLLTQANSLSTSGTVSVSATGTLLANAGGTGEFTSGTGNGTVGQLLGATYATGAVLGINTTNATAAVTTNANVSSAILLEKLGTGTLSISGTVDSTVLAVNGGTLALSGGSAGNAFLNGNNLASSGAGTLLITGGTYNTTAVGAVVFGLDFGAVAPLGSTIAPTTGVQMTGGTWNFSQTFAVARNGSGVVVLNGGTIDSTASGAKLSISRGGNAGNTGELFVESGTLDLSKSTLSVDVAIADSQTAGNNGVGELVVTGGTFNNGNNIIQINSLQTGAQGEGLMLIAGGTTTTGAIQFGGGGAFTAGSQAILTQTGGTLYVGSGGLQLTSGTTGLTPSITLSGGIVGATANWSSSLNISTGTTALTTGSITFQTANASNAAENITLSGVLSGTGGLMETGSGMLSLSGSNTYSGGTTLTGGTLQLANARALGSANSYATSLNINGGTLDLDGNNFNDGANFTFSSGSIVNNSSTAATMTVGNSNVGGTYAGNFGNGTGTLALTKAGTGTIILTGANTYTGPTAVNAGILQYGNSGAMATGSSITVANGATVQLADSINVASSATITINGAGAAGGTGALEYLGTSGSNTGFLSQSIALGSNATISSDTSGATFDLSSTGTLANNGFNLTVSGGTGGGSTEIDGVIAGSGGLIVNGGSNLLLTNQSTYTGGTTISNAATLVVGANNALSSTSTVTLGESTGNTTGILQLGATPGSSANQTLAYLATAGSGSGNEVIASSSSHTSTLTINNSANDTYSGRIGGVNNAQKNVALVMAGSATLTLSGSNTYTGQTQITAGTLNITGSTLATGTVTVASGAALSGTGSTGLVTVQGGGAINLRNGSVGTLTVGGLTTGNGTTASALTFDIGSSLGSIDSINDTGILTMLGTNGTTITIGNATGVSSLATGLYNLITYSGTETGGLANLSLLTTSLDGDTLSLVQGNGVIELQVSGVVAQAYFNGQGSDLATAGNYYTTAGGNTTTGSAPGSTTDVFITSNNSSTTGSSVLSPTLNSALAINSLTFTGAGTPATAGVNLTGTGTLTIEAATTTGNGGTNTAPNGITVQTGAGNDTVGVAVALGASQTWSVTDATNTLTVSGQVSDGGHGFALTTAGAGVVALSGSNTYSGGTTVSAGTLLASNTIAGGSATGTGSLTVNGGATLGGYGTSSGTSFSISGTGTTTGARANVLVGMNSASDGNTSQVLTVLGSGSSTIQNANLTFNLNAQGHGALGSDPTNSGTELSVGNTNISFGTATGSVQLTLNLQNAAIVSANSPYVLIAGSGLTTDTGGVSGGQYTGLTLGAVTNLGNGATETLITGSNLALAFSGSTNQAYYGANSYLVLYQSAGVDDIDVIVVPEPGTWALMLGGLAVLVFWQRTRRRY